MNEEDKKRNTDCVYFLASPLTCKKDCSSSACERNWSTFSNIHTKKQNRLSAKQLERLVYCRENLRIIEKYKSPVGGLRQGNDCEYRHSENARVNPRDCWYWLGGNCLNARCPFRHPPLDGRPISAQDTTTATSTGRPANNNNNNTSLTTPAVGRPTSLAYLSVKPKVSCYFFSQGLCMRGDKCGFMHNSSPEMPKPTTQVVSNGKPLPSENGEQRQESVGGTQKVPQEAPQKVTQNVPQVKSIAQSVVPKTQEKVTEHVIQVILMPRKTAKVPVTKEQAFVKDRRLVQEADKLKREWEENAVRNVGLGMDRTENGRPPLRLSSSGYNVANGESEKAEFRSRYGYVSSTYCGQQTGHKSGDKRLMQSEKDLCHIDLRNHIGKRQKTEGTNNGQDKYDDNERTCQEISVRDCLDSPTQQGLSCHGRVYHDNALASRNSSPDRNPIKRSPPRNRVNELVLDPTNVKMGGGAFRLNSFDFAAPKSLAQIKAEKLANWKVHSSLALNGWKPDDESALEFDGPKHLNASLKEKSRPFSEMEVRSNKEGSLALREEPIEEGEFVRLSNLHSSAPLQSENDNAEPLDAIVKDKGNPLLEAEATIDGKAYAKRLTNEAVSLQEEVVDEKEFVRRLNPQPKDNGKADASEFMHLLRQPEEKKSRIEANNGEEEDKNRCLATGSANPLDTDDNDDYVMDDNSDDDNNEFATRINRFFS